MEKTCLQDTKTCLNMTSDRQKNLLRTLSMHGWFWRSMFPCWSKQVLPTFNIRVFQEKPRKCLYLATLFTAFTLLERSSSC